MHLRRLGRRIDQRRGQLGQTELRIGRRLQDELESECDPATWGEGGPPPGWPDATLIFITRSRVQRRLIVELATEVEALGADPFQAEIRNELQHALARMPHAMDAHFHDAGPMVVAWFPLTGLPRTGPQLPAGG